MFDIVDKFKEENVAIILSGENLDIYLLEKILG